MRSVQLTVAEGPDAGKSLNIAEGRARIGTADNNDLVLRDLTFSSLLCEVVVGREGVRIIVEGSCYGS